MAVSLIDKKLDGKLDRQLHTLECICQPIEDWWAVRNEVTLIDVRSHSEHLDGTIPNAINIELLNDRERADVGTTWNRQGHIEAVKRGYEFGDASISDMLERFKQLPKDKALYVFCARGGLRSRIACNLMSLAGLEPILITGGYKRYRRLCHDYLENFEHTAAKFILLNGLTGSGKTLILEQMSNALDLEGCANHSGSAFGGIWYDTDDHKKFRS